MEGADRKPCGWQTGFTTTLAHSATWTKWMLQQRSPCVAAPHWSDGSHNRAKAWPWGAVAAQILSRVWTGRGSHCWWLYGGPSEADHVSMVARPPHSMPHSRWTPTLALFLQHCSALRLRVLSLGGSRTYTYREQSQLGPDPQGFRSGNLGPDPAPIG